MAKKTSIKVRLVPEAKPDSPFFYYVKKPSSGEKAKVKLKIKMLDFSCQNIIPESMLYTRFSGNFEEFRPI